MVTLQGFVFIQYQRTFFTTVTSDQTTVALRKIRTTPERTILALTPVNGSAATGWAGEFYGDMTQLFDVVALAFQ